MSKRAVFILLAVVLGCVGLFFLWPESQGAKEAAEQESQGEGATARRASADKHGPGSHPLKKSGAIGGQIVDPDRKGIAGAQVCAVSFGDALTDEDQQGPNCILAGADGRFSFPYLWAGSHSIEATARGFLPSNDIEGQDSGKAWAGDIEIEEGEEHKGLVIVLTPGGVELVGEVTDVGGGPIAGAWVELHPQSLSGRSLPGASSRAISDQEGVVRLWLAEGGYGVEVSAEGYVTERSELLVPGMSLHMALVPGSSLRGRVVYGQEGEPAAYASVLASREKGSSYTARADQNGDFLFTRLAAGRYEVSAVGDGGRGTAPHSVVLALGQDVEGVVVPLEPGVSVVGVVAREGSDKPCDKATGMLRADDRRESLRSEGEGEEGKIHIEAVPPGKYNILVSCDEGRRSRAGKLEVKTEDILDQRWTVEEGLSMRVLVRDEGGVGVPQASVRLSEANSTDIFSRGGGSGQTDREGVATVLTQSEGKFKVDVSADALVMKGEAPEVDLKASGQEITVVMTDGGTIAGVVRVSTGELPRGLNVSARPDKDDDPFARMTGGSKAMVLDDGSFRLEGLAAGSYRLAVTQGRWSFSSIETKENEAYQVSLGSVTDARLTIEGHTGTVSGRVVDSRNKPVVDAFVRVVQDEGEEMRRLASMRLRYSFFGKDATLTDTDGRFEVDGLAEGPYVVRAYRRGGGEAVEEGVAEGSDLTLTISDTGSIRGTVLSSSGAPVKSYSIHCKNTKTEFDRKERFSGGNGQFSIGDLPSGTYVLSVSANEGTAVSEDLTLDAGGTIEGLSLRLNSSGTVVGRVVSLIEGTPIEGMHVSARATRGDLGTRNSFLDGNATGADGRFELEGVPAGPVVLWGFSGRGKAGEWGPVNAHAEIPPGGKVDLGDLVVARMQASFEEAGDLGFDIDEPDPPVEKEGLIVGAVDEEGPAHKAGLQTGDQIVAIDGHDVVGKSHLFVPLALVPAGNTVRLGLEDGRTLSITAVRRKGK
jgi:protocatechuate 3,4-dioxygenase beta subunit